MRIITLLVLTLSLSACTKYSHDELENIAVQAKTYSNYFHNNPHGNPPVLSKFRQGELVETFYFDFTLNRIGHKSYSNASPYQQFFEMLKENSNLPFAEASKQLKSNFKNYFSEDCPNIGEFLSKIKSLEIEYKQEMYSLSMNEPAYRYYYKEPKLPITYTLTTGIEEHPIAKLSEEAHKAIENCPHPKEPPKL